MAKEGDVDRNLEEITHWEKIFAKYLSNDWHGSGIYQLYIFKVYLALNYSPESG